MEQKASENVSGARGAGSGVGGPVDPKRAQRRTLRFDSLGEAMEEAERLAASERAGELRATGNWSLGTTLAHLAWWADEAFEERRFPLYLRLLFRVLGPLAKSRALRGEMSPNAKLPGVRGGTYGVEETPTDEGMARFRGVFERLDREAPERRNPAFGWMTHDEWRSLHIRHAEHHFAYFWPSEETQRLSRRPAVDTGVV